MTKTYAINVNIEKLDWTRKSNIHDFALLYETYFRAINKCAYTETT